MIYVLDIKFVTTMAWIAFYSLTIPISRVYMSGVAGKNNFLPAGAACAGGPTCASVRTGLHDLADATQRRDQSAIRHLKFYIK
jgi:hypothetical protein